MTAAHAHRGAGAPRKRGPWLFVGLWIIFWALLMVGGLDRFKAPDRDGRRYLLPAEQLDGVTRLRIEGDPSDTHGYAPEPRVVLTGSSVVTIGLQSRYDGHPRRSRGGRQQPGQRADPPLVAVREGDTLVLRWLPLAPSPDNQSDGRDDEWISEIVLPLQFQSLVLPHAVVDVSEPVERLSVSAESVEVEGSVVHLELQSTLCGRCPPEGREGASQEEGRELCSTRTRHGREPLLEVSAKKMQSVRVSASVGRVSLKDTQRLQQLELRLGDGVALSVDRAGVLKLARSEAQPTAGAATALAASASCATAAASGPVSANSRTLMLVRMDVSPAATK